MRWRFRWSGNIQRGVGLAGSFVNGIRTGRPDEIRDETDCVPDNDPAMRRNVAEDPEEKEKDQEKSQKYEKELPFWKFLQLCGMLSDVSQGGVIGAFSRDLF